MAKKNCFEKLQGNNKLYRILWGSTFGRVVKKYQESPVLLAAQIVLLATVP